MTKIKYRNSILVSLCVCAFYTRTLDSLRKVAVMVVAPDVGYVAITMINVLGVCLSNNDLRSQLN